MSVGMLALLAVIPILVALVLMVGLRWPATRAMPLAWFVCAVSGVIGWKLDLLYLAALSLQGVVVAIGVLIIVLVLGGVYYLFRKYGRR